MAFGGELLEVLECPRCKGDTGLNEKKNCYATGADSFIRYVMLRDEAKPAGGL